MKAREPPCGNLSTLVRECLLSFTGLAPGMPGSHTGFSSVAKISEPVRADGPLNTCIFNQLSKRVNLEASQMAERGTWLSWPDWTPGVTASHVLLVSAKTPDSPRKHSPAVLTCSAPRTLQTSRGSGRRRAAAVCTSAPT